MKRRNLREVAQQVALGERRLLQRRIRGPVDAIEVRQPDPVRSHRERERGLRVVQLRDDLVDRAARGDGCGTVRRAAGIGAAHRLRIDVVAQPQEDRRAQAPSSVQLWKLHLGDDFGLDPGRRAIELRLLGERAGASLQRLQPLASTCASVRSSNPEPTCEA